MSIRAGLLCLLVLVAGCSGSGPTGDSQTVDSTESFTEPVAHPGMTADVDVRNLALAPVHITIIELNENGRGVVLDETYTDKVAIELDEDDVFRVNGRYRVTVRIDGTVRWNTTVEHYEGYELRIENNGSVTVTTHAMA